MTITVSSEKTVSFSDPNWLVGTSWKLRTFDGYKVEDRADTEKGGWDFYDKGVVKDKLGSWTGTWKVLYYTPDLMCVRVFIREGTERDAIFVHDNNDKFFIGVNSITRELMYSAERRTA